MYYFKPLTGELQWKTYIGSWATSVSVGKKYIAGFMGQQAAWSPDGKYLGVKTNTSLYVSKRRQEKCFGQRKLLIPMEATLYCTVLKTRSTSLQGSVKSKVWENYIFISEQLDRQS